MPAGAQTAATGVPLTPPRKPGLALGDADRVQPAPAALDRPHRARADGQVPRAGGRASTCRCSWRATPRPAATAENAIAPRGRRAARSGPGCGAGPLGWWWCAEAPTSGSRPPFAASVTPPNTNATAQATAGTSSRRPRRRRASAGGGSASSAARSARSVASAPGGGEARRARSRRPSSSSGIPLPFPFTQVVERAGEARVHGAHGQLEQLRDGRGRVAEAVAQDDHDPPLGRELRRPHRAAGGPRRPGRATPPPADRARRDRPAGVRSAAGRASG